MWACCAEITCCLCFAFPCIFLCHPCIEHAITSQRIQEFVFTFFLLFLFLLLLLLTLTPPLLLSFFLSFPSKCNEINRKYFLNQPIVSYGQDGVTINYARLEIMNQPYVSPALVSVSPIHNQAPKYAYATPAPIVTAIPIQPPPQQLQVTIPEGYPPGSTITVATPNGQQISVRNDSFLLI